MSAASKRAKTRFRKIGALVGAYTGKHNWPEEDKQLLRRMLGYVQPNNSMLACDFSIRLRAGKEFGNMLIDLWKENPALKFYFWTIIHTKGNTSDRAPVIDLKGIQSLTDKVLRKFEMNSLSVFEIQGLTNWPQGGEGRMLMGHGHAVSWTERDFPHETAMNIYRDSKAWPKPFGADPVDIQLIEASEEDLRTVAYYMFKPPYDAKRREMPGGQVRLTQTEKGYRPEFAVRILEGLSQLDFKSIVRSTGDGSHLRTDLMRRLTHRHKSRADWRPGTFDEWSVEALWDRYRNKKRKNEYLPYIFKR